MAQIYILNIINMEAEISKLLEWAIKELYEIELWDISLNEVPKKQFGDLSFNCWILARETKKNPALIANELLEILWKNDLIEEVQSAWAFLNFKISDGIYSDIFKKIYSDKENFFSVVDANNETIYVDYIWMNVGKPMHIWHMCTPNIGQAIINLYTQNGFHVVSDSHIWDWGIVFWKLITAFKLWWNLEELKNNPVDYLLELYVKVTSEAAKDDTYEQRFRDEFKLLSGGDKESIALWAEFTSHTIKDMNKQLARLSVYPTYNIWESFYEGIWLPKLEDYPDLEFDMHSIVKELIEKWIATQNEDGSVWVVFGDDTKLPSCILQKKDGTHGYLASDLASIKYRVHNFSPSKIIYFVDVRQQLHFQQLFEISTQAKWLYNWSHKTELIHAANWFISWKDGAFSTRKWNIIKLDVLLNQAESKAKAIILEKRTDLSEEELLELSKQIWIWAIKYGHLKKSRDNDMIFDWDEFMTFEWNSGPYIQYAYVRARRILEKYWKTIWVTDADFEHEQEINLLKWMQKYTQIVEKTLETNMPHILCNYTYDLTKKFNTFYNSVHILNEEDENKKMLRLQLVDMFTMILKNNFTILGIQMPEKM